MRRDPIFHETPRHSPRDPYARQASRRSGIRVNFGLNWLPLAQPRTRVDFDPNSQRPWVRVLVYGFSAKTVMVGFAPPISPTTRKIRI
jgi:hypothetical protein